jgi:hypothetical protein
MQIRRKTMNPSRFNKLSTAGQVKVDENRGDIFTQTITFPITVVAASTEQDTGILLPPNCQVIRATINVFTAEATGATKLVDLGVVGTPTAIITNGNVAGTGFVGVGTVVNTGAVNLSYTLGSADYVELDAEAVVVIMGTEG